MPPCANQVLETAGSAEREISVTGTPLSANSKAVIPPAMPEPITKTSVCKQVVILADFNHTLYGFFRFNTNLFIYFYFILDIL